MRDPDTTKGVLVTGAAGAIGSALRPILAARGYPLLRTTDRREPASRVAAESFVAADLTDAAAVDALMEGIGCVVHLSGVPREGPWEAILPNNIAATFNVFEAARRHGVARIVYASSNHVVGFYRSERTLGPDLLPRPDTRYGVSKVFGEALGRLYADKHAMSVVCLRIGSFRVEPENRRQLATWVSPRDLGQLVVRSIETPGLRYEVFYGVSANTRAKWRDNAKARIGFVPVDNAEDYASRFANEPPEDPRSPGVLFHGGHQVATEFDGDIDAID